MSELLNYINEYADCLSKAAVWENSREPIAPVIDKDGHVAEDNYVYEFYCYISLIVDLMANYEIQFVPGIGNFKHKFPQAAAVKAGKPKFIALKDDIVAFQICAGTRVNCTISSEENHPDISFQLPNASDDPSDTDLISIMDAKYKENHKSNLPKDEVYKFGIIVDLFDLPDKPQIEIKFNKYQHMFGNSLLTNAGAYSNVNDVRLLNKYKVKEVEYFFPGQQFNVLG